MLMETAEIAMINQNNPSIYICYRHVAEPENLIIALVRKHYTAGAEQHNANGNSKDSND